MYRKVLLRAGNFIAYFVGLVEQTQSLKLRSRLLTTHLVRLGVTLGRLRGLCWVVIETKETFKYNDQLRRGDLHQPINELMTSNGDSKSHVLTSRMNDFLCFEMCA